MLDLYTWTTPNGLKPLIMLEELGLSAEIHGVDLSRGAQREAEYLKLNPNGKIPSLVDHLADGDEVRVFESGAILIYLAEKTGRFLPAAGQPRVDTLAWLMFQVGAVGPMFAQLGHFEMERPDVTYGLERYGKEVERLAGVLDERLAEHAYLAGDYSIADIATFPWAAALEPRLGLARERLPNVARWLDAIAARPAVIKARAWKP
jgi:GSH-dependent disulfide-bond oxidoreductase